MPRISETPALIQAINKQKGAVLKGFYLVFCLNPYQNSPFVFIHNFTISGRMIMKYLSLALLLLLSVSCSTVTVFQGKVIYGSYNVMTDTITYTTNAVTGEVFLSGQTNKAQVNESGDFTLLVDDGIIMGTAAERFYSLVSISGADTGTLVVKARPGSANSGLFIILGTKYYMTNN